MKDMKSQRIAEILKSGAEDTDIVVKEIGRAHV